jgi:RarD protein
MEKNLKSKIIFIISMVIFGTIAVFVKAINVSSGEIALYRAILAALIIGLYLLITKQRIQIKEVKKDLALIAISGMLMGFNWIFLFEAYKYTTVSVSTLAYYFAPIIVMIVCPLLLKEKLTKKQIICFILSTIGLVLIIGISDLSLNSRHTIGVLLGLSAAVFYAAVIIINKYIKSISGIHRTLIQFLAAIIVLFPYVLITSGITINNLETKGWICLLIVGIVHTGITYCAYFSSLKNLKGQTVALLSYIDPLVAVLISFLMNEKMTFLQIIGGILIILGTILNEIKIKNIKYAQ